MPESASKAVFLSYASQDAEAAKRICETLRAAGVEVWFDQSELVGGDAWDAKIRLQLATCALFVPVISKATQARREGYFRLEWKLADERTHLMAEGTPFLFPVVIDDTKDREALVPKSFLAVQWTRLPAGEATPTFVARIKSLLAGSTATSASKIGEPMAPQNLAVPVAAKSVLTAGLFAALAVVVLGLIAFFALRPASNQPTATAGTAITGKVAATAAPVMNEKSIAVLPFEDRSEGKSNAIFTDGVHNDLVTSLTNIRELHVIARTSVLEYRNTTKKISQIARELGVAFVLDGSVQRLGSSVRITGQLIRAATDQQVWAKNFDKELTATNVFAIQTELAQAIASELKAVLSPQEQKLIARLPTASLDAYDLFLKARDLRERLNTSEAIVESVKLLDRAVVTDPQFGLAWAKLAWGKAFLYFRSEYSVADQKGIDLRAQAREALARAELLIPGTSELLLSRGWYYYFGETDFGRALVEFQRASELSPNFGEARYAMAVGQRRLGRWPDSLASFRAAVLIEPANPEYRQELATLLLSGRRYAEAEAELRRTESLGRTGSSLRAVQATLALYARGELPTESALAELDAVYDRRFFESLRGKLPEKSSVAEVALDRAFGLAARGERDAARTELEDPIKILRRRLEAEQTNIYGWANLAMMEALRGNREEALRCARSFSEAPRIARDAWYGSDSMATLVYVHAWTGDLAGACDELTRLLQTPVYPTGAAINVFALRLHPAFAPLRGYPRFEALLNDPKNNAPLF